MRDDDRYGADLLYDYPRRFPKYPTRRAYVVKVRGDAKPDALAGRVENLVTGRQCDFASGFELLESIASDLEANLHERPPDAECK